MRRLLFELFAAAFLVACQQPGELTGPPTKPKPPEPPPTYRWGPPLVCLGDQATTMEWVPNTGPARYQADWSIPDTLVGGAVRRFSFSVQIEPGARPQFEVWVGEPLPDDRMQGIWHVPFGRIPAPTTDGVVEFAIDSTSAAKLANFPQLRAKVFLTATPGTLKVGVNGGKVAAWIHRETRHPRP